MLGFLIRMARLFIARLKGSVSGGTVTVTLSPLTTISLTVGTAFTRTFTASGGMSPYTYAVATGALPAGMSLNSSTGVLSGTPTTAAAFAFGITATDSASHVSSVGTFSGTVAAAFTGFPSTIDSTISPPVISLATANLTYPPQINYEWDDTHQIGDTIWAVRFDDPALSAGRTEYSHVITLAEYNGGTFTFPLSDVTSGTHRFVGYVSRGSVRSSGSNTLTQGPDDVAPVLSNFAAPSGGLGATSATFTVDTDEGNGTLYYVLTNSSTQPSKAQIKAGQDATGSAALKAGNQAITATGTKSFTPTGLTSSTTYYAHVMQEDSTGNQSARLTGSFVTASAATSIAKLVQGTGTTGSSNASQYISSTDGYTATMNNSPGAPALIKSLDAMPNQWHAEVSIVTLPGIDFIYCGVTDAAAAVGPGAGFSQRPGDSGGQAGVTLPLQAGQTSLFPRVNGGNPATWVAATSVAAGQKVIIEGSRTTNIVTFKHLVGSTLTTLGSVTLTSQIPTNWVLFVGGHNNTDSMTVNFGASAWASTPTSGYTGW